MKKIYLIICMIMCAVFQAQIVHIPDANFKSLLVANMPYLAKDLSHNNTIIDSNGDGEIQVSEAADISELNFDLLNIPGYSALFDGVISIEGIKSFTNLTIFI